MHPALYAHMASDARADELEQRIRDLMDRLRNVESRASLWQTYAMALKRELEAHCGTSRPVDR